jgi:hypothetical protein
LSTRFALAFMLALSLAVPAQAGLFGPDRVPKEKLAAIKSIAVMVALNHEMTVQQLSPPPFDSSSTWLPTGDWMLDDLVVRTATDALSPRFKVSESSVAASDFRENKTDLVREAYDMEDRLKEAIGSAPKEADAWLLVKSYNFFQPDGGFGPRGPSIYGLSIVRHKLITSFYTQDAMVKVLLIDAKSGETLSETDLDPMERRLDTKDWADTADTLSPAQIDDLKRGYTAMVADGLRGALKDMGLTR